MASRFLPFATIADDLHYDIAGARGKQARAALLSWLSRHGLYPELKRGLYRADEYNAVIERLRVERSRRRKRGLQSRTANFQQSHDGSNHGLSVTGERVSQVHDGNDSERESGSRLHSLDSGVAR